MRELCTNYGEIHGFWWDMNVPQHKDPSINAMIRKLQPKAVINNRGFDEGDFGTPERDYEKDAVAGFDRPTEACQAVGMESWGYRKDEDYYTDRHLIRSIDRVPRPRRQLPAQRRPQAGRHDSPGSVRHSAAASANGTTPSRSRWKTSSRPRT